MRLKKLTLTDFRQFRGQNTIEFASGENQNVTVIYGMNSFGKSTILNAICWALHGKTQPDFENPDMLLNFNAQKNGGSTSSVNLQFEFEQKIYEINRLVEYTFLGNGKFKSKHSCTLYEKSEFGSSTPVPRIEALVNRVVPPEMSSQFFFHGEKKAQSMQGNANKKNVKTAIRQILGSTTLDTTIADLRQVERKFNKELSDDLDDQQIKDLARNIESILDRISELESTIEKKKSQIDLAQDAMSDADKVLENNAGSKEIQESLQSKIIDLQGQTRELNENKVLLFEWLRKDAIYSMSFSLANDTEDLIDLPEIRGKLPADYQEPFIMNILNSLECICGRSFSEGEIEYEKIRSLLTDAGDKNIQEKAIEAQSAVKYFQDRYRPARHSYQQISKRIEASHSKIKKLDDEIDELQEKLRKVDIEAVRDANEKKQKSLEIIKQLTSETGDISRKIKMELKPLLKKQQEDYDKMTATVPRKIKQKKLRDICGNLATYLEDVANEHELIARNEIGKILNQYVSKMHRSYDAEFDSDFNLQLRNKETNFYGSRSTGENQMLTLAFTAALINFCSKRLHESSRLFIPGTVAPLVLDAPFGQLDSTFQSVIVESIPELAEQVVILVSDFQSAGLQSSRTKQFIGKEYILVLSSVGSDTTSINETRYHLGAITLNALSQLGDSGDVSIEEVT
ncbi:MAG: AAA family ATPase [Oligoflexus sp.]